MRVGPYEILSSLGAGGMGQVYRARDTRLNRDVALKVLPDVFASDPERLARFEREAQLLASLNHPHIAAIYGLEQDVASGFSRTSPALVMELVEGETLAARLERGALPLDDAVAIARQITDALEAAHDRGVIHRDLKPANISVTPAGAVKVLDFGLAKLVEASGAGGAGRAGGVTVSLSPTITSPAMMTGVGVLLGTAAYMSPEQAKGREADKRSDIWAFGCVLYEMLAGRRPFHGEDVSDTLAATLMRDPDWAALPGSTPASVRRLIERCLRKDPRQRLHDIADARLELDDIASGREEPAGPAPRQSRLRQGVPWVIAAALLVVAGVQTWWLSRGGDAAPSVSFSMTPPAGVDIGSSGARIATMSPDGRRVVLSYTRNGVGQLYRRDLDQLVAVPIAGAERGVAPFFSPDGRWVAFQDRNVMKKVSIDGGAAVTIVETGWGNGTWGADDSIVYTADYSTGLWRVSAGGGTPQKLTDPDTARGELGHWWPQFLPGGKTVLFTAFTTPAERSRVQAYSLETGQITTVLEGGMHARYVASGHLVFAQSSTLMAVPFDLARIAPVGQATPVLDGVAAYLPNGISQFSVSDSGTLAYVPAEQAPRRLVWVDRKGVAQPVSDLARTIDRPRLSPDGGRVALTIRDASETDVWMYDLARGGLARLTFAPGAQFDAVWAPGGQRLFFASEEPVFHVYARDLDAAGDPQRLIDGPDDVVPTSITPDGRLLIYHRNSPKTREDIWALPLTGDATPRVLVQTPFSEEDAAVSPDARWLAYQSDETGRDEIYVQRFPDGGGRVQVSTNGGSHAAWSRDGRELFFREVNKMMAVSVNSLPSVIGRPAMLFEMRLEAGFDVARDGRFLAVQRDPQAPPTPVHVVLNWFDELTRRVPVP